MIPIVIGITAEFADPAVRSTPLKGFQIYGWSGIAGVIRELISRGLADLESEQAIIAAHKGGGASAAFNAEG